MDCQQCSISDATIIKRLLIRKADWIVWEESEMLRSLVALSRVQAHHSYPMGK